MQDTDITVLFLLILALCIHIIYTKTCRRLCASVVNIFLPLQIWSANICKTAAIIWISYLTVSDFISSYMGRDFDDCNRFTSSCQVSWFCRVYGISWRGQRSRGDEVLFANGTLARVFSASVASAVTLEEFRDSWQAIWTYDSRRVWVNRRSSVEWFGGPPDGKNLK